MCLVRTNIQNKGSDADLISVVVVTYNAIKSIQETIDSISAQTYKNTEIIIIDGGSTDGTWDFISENGVLFAYSVSEPDKGIYDAMNKGIAASKGKWLIFMNSGDTFTSGTVLNQIFSTNAVLPDTKIIYGNTVVKPSGAIINPPGRITRRFFYYETICHQSLFTRRDAFNDIGIFNTAFKIAADREWLLKASQSKIAFQYVPVEVCVWETDGFSSANAALSLRENTTLQKNYFTIFDRMICPWLTRFKNMQNKIRAQFS